MISSAMSKCVVGLNTAKLKVNIECFGILWILAEVNEDLQSSLMLSGNLVYTVTN